MKKSKIRRRPDGSIPGADEYIYWIMISPVFIINDISLNGFSTKNIFDDHLMRQNIGIKYINDSKGLIDLFDFCSTGDSERVLKISIDDGISEGFEFDSRIIKEMAKLNLGLSIERFFSDSKF